jgi:hypothetical protein
VDGFWGLRFRRRQAIEVASTSRFAAGEVVAKVHAFSGTERLRLDFAFLADEHFDARFGLFELFAAGVAEAHAFFKQLEERSSGRSPASSSLTTFSSSSRPQKRTSPGFAIVGTSRTPLTDDQFRDKMKEAVTSFSEDTQLDEDVWKTFAEGLHYVAGDLGDVGLFQRIGEKLAHLDEAHQTGGNVLFYLSTQPSQYALAAQGIGAAGLQHGAGWRRLVVEKPFGHDLASARELSDRLHEVFDRIRRLPHRSLPG